MSRADPTTLAEMHARYLESRARLGMGRPVETPRARLAPLLRPVPEEVVPDRDLRPVEIEALADALMRRMCKDSGDLGTLPRPIMLHDVIAAVAKRAGLTSIDIRSERRTPPVARARHQAMWLARRLTMRSLPAIGRSLARDHTSVIYGLRRIDAQRVDDVDLQTELDELEAELRGRFELPARCPDPVPGSDATS